MFSRLHYFKYIHYSVYKVGNLCRLEVQYLQLGIPNSFPDFLLTLKFPDSGMQTCLTFWNMSLVSRSA